MTTGITTFVDHDSDLHQNNHFNRQQQQQPQPQPQQRPSTNNDAQNNHNNLFDNHVNHQQQSASESSSSSSMVRPSSDQIHQRSAADVSAVRKIRLLSPVGAEAAEYDWPLVVSNKFNAANEIIDTIRFVADEFPPLETALKNILADYDTSSYEKIKLFCDRYNKVIKGSVQMWKGTSIPEPEKRPTIELLSHIIQMCYNHSVGDPQKLNKFYEPFSPEVYGETSFKFVQQMIDDIGIGKDDVFIDLGSGIGQVVLHVAAAVNCVRCIGIEKADLPATYAEKMKKQFQFWLKWYGRKCSDFELYRGDFFSEEFKETIYNSNFIFVNNFAFGPEVDHRLKGYFQNLLDGSKILSSKAFCSLNFRFSQRNLSDIGAMMTVKEILPRDQSVSWTGRPVSYYLHIIDRKQLALYFEKSKHRLKSTNNGHNSSSIYNNSNSHNNRKSSHHRKQQQIVSLTQPTTIDNSSIIESSSIDEENFIVTNNKLNNNIESTVNINNNQQQQLNDMIKNDENMIPNKWTRKAWSEYISSNSNNNNNNSGHNNNNNSTTNQSQSIDNSDENQLSPCKSPLTQQQQQQRKRNRGRPKKTDIPNDEMNDYNSDNVNNHNEETSHNVVDNGNHFNSFDDEDVVFENSRLNGDDRDENDPNEVDDDNDNSRNRGRPPKKTASSNHRKNKSKRKSSLFTTGRTKKSFKGISMNSLSVLHEKTVLSTATTVNSNVPNNCRRYSSPAPGCVDQRLCSRLDEITVQVPDITVINTDLIAAAVANASCDLASPTTALRQQMTPPATDNDEGSRSDAKSPKMIKEFNGIPLCRPLNLNELLYLFANQIQSFNSFMKKPEYQETVKKEIEKLESENDDMNYQINQMNKKIYEDKFNVKRLLKDLNLETSSDISNKIDEVNDNVNEMKTQITNLKQLITTRRNELNELCMEAQRIYFERHERDNRQLNEQRNLLKELYARERQLQQQIDEQTQQIDKQQRQILEQQAQLQQQQQQQQNVEPSVASTESVDSIESPKISYKEMKYKKYLKRTNRANTPPPPLPPPMQPTTAAVSAAVTSVTSESVAPMTPPTPTLTPPSTSNDVDSSSKSSDAIKIDLNRINSVIMKGFNEEKAANATAVAVESANKSTSNQTMKRQSSINSSSTTSSETSSSKQSSSNKRTRNSKKETKIETLKTKKGDHRDVIMTAGCLTTVVSRKNSNSKADFNANHSDPISTKANDSKSSKSSSSSDAESQKPFPFKLKINCKESKVKILNDIESDHSKSVSKRKSSTTTSLNESEKSKNKKSKSSEAIVHSTNENTSSPAELKRPSVVIRLGSNGQYYSQTPLAEGDDLDQDNNNENTDKTKPTIKTDDSLANDSDAKSKKSIESPKLSNSTGKSSSRKSRNSTAKHSKQQTSVAAKDVPVKCPTLNNDNSMYNNQSNDVVNHQPKQQQQNLSTYDQYSSKPMHQTTASTTSSTDLAVNYLNFFNNITDEIQTKNSYLNEYLQAAAATGQHFYNSLNQHNSFAKNKANGNDQGIDSCPPSTYHHHHRQPQQQQQHHKDFYDQAMQQFNKTGQLLQQYGLMGGGHNPHQTSTTTNGHFDYHQSSLAAAAASCRYQNQSSTTNGLPPSTIQNNHTNSNDSYSNSLHMTSDGGGGGSSLDSLMSAAAAAVDTNSIHHTSHHSMGSKSSKDHNGKPPQTAAAAANAFYNQKMIF